MAAPTTVDQRPEFAVAGLARFPLPTVALIAVAVTWGVSFSVVDGAADALPAADLVAWRFGLATLVLTLAGRAAVPLPSEMRRRSIVLGALLGAGFLLQAWAMTYTDALMSGFLIGTLVVLAPLFNWALFAERPSGSTWVAVAVASAGLGLLSLRGAGFGVGELLTVLAAATWALHLVLLSRWARAEHALALARAQTGTVAAMALISVAVGGAVTGTGMLPRLPVDGTTWAAVAFLAVLATAAAMVALSWAQSRLSAARVAVVLTIEPAAGALTAAALGSEWTVRTLAGGALLIAAMLIVELGARGRWTRRTHRLRAVLSPRQEC
ncbi:DMT family transporter [Nakamurella sp. GG22]